MKTKSTDWMMALLLGGVLLGAEHCDGQDVTWQIVAGDLEFGITSTIDGVASQSPAVFEPGYSGAFVFGAPGLYAVGQTFRVSSTRELQSIELRVGGMNNQPVTGQFEVAVFRFDDVSNTPLEKVAAVLADGHNYYQYTLLHVPISSFDFSTAGLILSPTETYALAVTPTATYGGGALTLQGAIGSAYLDGSAYYLSIVPEPSGFALFSVGVLFLICVQRSRIGVTQPRRTRGSIRALAIK